MNPMEVAVAAMRVHLRTFADWITMTSYAELALMLCVTFAALSWLVISLFEFTFDHAAGAVFRTVVAALTVLVVRLRVEQTTQLKRSLGEQIELLKATPGGAPAIAQVPCGCGRRNRYVYTPAGWEAAGPAAPLRR